MQRISGVAMSPRGQSSSPTRCRPSGGIWFKWTFIRETFGRSCHRGNTSYWRFELLCQRVGYQRRYERGDIAPELGDFFNDTRAEIGVFLLGHEEDSFNFGVELPVHQRHLKFKLEIGNGAQPPHDRVRTLRGGEFHQQSFHGGDSHGIDRNRLPQHGESLIRREQGLLLIINRDRHDDFIKKLTCPLDDIEMTIYHRIEAARIDRASHGQKFVQESTVATLIESFSIKNSGRRTKSE